MNGSSNVIIVADHLIQVGLVFGGQVKNGVKRINGLAVIVADQAYIVGITLLQEPAEHQYF